MSTKKALTDEELFAQFEDIPSSTPNSTVPKIVSAENAAISNVQGLDNENDPLAELTALAQVKPASRPHTPHLSSSTASGATGPKIATPTSSGQASNRPSEEGERSKPRSSHEIRRDITAQSVAKKAEEDGSPEKSSAGGGWWGSVFTVASAAVKQAGDAVKEISSNEEAKKWAEQVRGNVETLKSYGDNVKSLAMPAFSNILHTIAPPISAHERLQIHTTHDIVGYPSLDPTVYAVFARVMSQVEGGDLLVIQRGSELRSRGRNVSEVGYRGAILGSRNSGWNDGPWWRDNTSKRDLGAVNGLVEGTKLARANAEAYAVEFFSEKGGLEEASRNAANVASETNPTRSSDIFLAIQAIRVPSEQNLFGHSQEQTSDSTDAGAKSKDDTMMAFAIYLHDPIHSIDFSVVSQTLPTQWIEWMEAEADQEDELPSAIRAMVEQGGVDAREWVSEWVEETLSLSIGIIAQRYVARRMGVGAGGNDQVLPRVRAEDQTAGEAARAL